MDNRPAFAGRLTMAVMLALLFVLASCTPSWEASLDAPDGGAFRVDRQALDGLSSFAEEVKGQQAVPLERVLAEAGYTAVGHVVVLESDAASHEFQWAAVADQAWWFDDGRLLVGGAEFAGSRLQVEAPSLSDRVKGGITDIAPTAATALGLPNPGDATGRALEVDSASRVVLILLDGFGYVRYTEALGEGLVPNLGALGEPLVALTTYPPITSVATASLLTGAPPDVHGVMERGIRKTEAQTLFDVAAAAGRRVMAVEGQSLAFELRNAGMKLSGDLDGNGSTDDNVLANALSILRAGVPDVLFVHFHGIDDAGHSYGPGSPEECAQIREVDAAVGQLVEVLPAGTLVILFADHGMHQVQEEGRLGNHGHLIERDMFVPILVVSK